jgi:hypothetical protein
MASRRRHRASSSAVEQETFARAINEIMRMLTDHLRELEALRDEQRVQFKRIAQLQAELDSMKRTLAKMMENIT